MRVSMEITIYQHLIGIKNDQFLHRRIKINIIFQQCFSIIKTHSLFEAHHDRIITAILLIRFWKDNTALLIRSRKTLQIRELILEAHLFEDHIGKFSDQCIHRIFGIVREKWPENTVEKSQDIDICMNLGNDLIASEFDSYMFTTFQPRFMYFSDRSTGNRYLFKTFKRLSVFKSTLIHFLKILRVHRRDLIMQGSQFIKINIVEKIGSRCQNLCELDEACTQFIDTYLKCFRRQRLKKKKALFMLDQQKNSHQKIKNLPNTPG